jgi:hypothetical protein
LLRLRGLSAKWVRAIRGGAMVRELERNSHSGLFTQALELLGRPLLIRPSTSLRIWPSSERSEDPRASEPRGKCNRGGYFDWFLKGAVEFDRRLGLPDVGEPQPG